MVMVDITLPQKGTESTKQSVRRASNMAGDERRAQVPASCCMDPGGKTPPSAVEGSFQRAEELNQVSQILFGEDLAQAFGHG